MRAMYAALGCSADVATALTVDEGLDSCEELAELDESDVRQLCKTIRNPGGGQQGHTVSNRAVCYLTQAAMHCRMMVRVNRPLVPADIRPLAGMLATAHSQLELEDKHKNDDALFMPLENKGLKDHLFSTQMEKWIERLDSRRNAQRVPISYVCRPDLLVVAHADDPVTNYTSHDQQVRLRMRIILNGREGEPAAELESNKAANWTAQANGDNHSVFDLGELCFLNTRYWIFIGKVI